MKTKEDKKIKQDPTLEYPDPQPTHIHPDLKRAETMDEKIRRIVKVNVSQAAMEAGTETLDEANDFDVLDDFEVPEPVSKHEVFDMEPEYPVGSNPLTEPAPDPEGDSSPSGQEKNSPSNSSGSEPDGGDPAGSETQP